MGRFRRRSQQLMEPEPDVEPDGRAGTPEWAADDSWRTIWEAPRNWIYGESRDLAAMRSLTGTPRERGYLVPVDVVLEREPNSAHDPNAIAALVRGVRVGSLARSIADEISPEMGAAGLVSIRVPGIIRGGALMAPHLGVHVWFGHGDSPVRPSDRGGRVSWPPYPGEGDV